MLPALEGLTVEETSWRPNPEQKTAGEMIRHMAYWKDAVTARITGQPWKYEEEQNWRSVPATTGGLEDARTELAASHDRLLAALRTLTPQRIFEHLGRAWWREEPDPNDARAVAITAPALMIDYALGAAQHDMYHAAQVFVLRRLYKHR